MRALRRLLITAVALIVVPSATAATLAITIGTASPVTAPGVTLTGIDQTKTFTVASTVSYTPPANTAGWNETASATIPTSAGKLLPALIVSGVAAAACTGGGCIDAVNSVTWPVTVGTTAVKVFNAAAGTGTRSVVLTHTFVITYPANALPGTYSSTITLSLVSGP